MEKKLTKLWDIIRKNFYHVCDLMEIIMAVAVAVGIIVATTAVIPGLKEFIEHKNEVGAFIEYLDIIFQVVIGIEFMKMLCKPNTANIIEALIFVAARHLIMQSPGAVETLLFVISISILFAFRIFMDVKHLDK